MENNINLSAAQVQVTREHVQQEHKSHEYELVSPGRLELFNFRAICTDEIAINININFFPSAVLRAIFDAGGRSARIPYNSIEFLKCYNKYAGGIENCLQVAPNNISCQEVLIGCLEIFYHFVWEEAKVQQTFIEDFTITGKIRIAYNNEHECRKYIFLCDYKLDIGSFCDKVQQKYKNITNVEMLITPKRYKKVGKNTKFIDVRVGKDGGYYAESDFTDLDTLDKNKNDREFITKYFKKYIFDIVAREEFSDYMKILTLDFEE
jgi:hypothetical protein